MVECALLEASPYERLVPGFSQQHELASRG